MSCSNTEYPILEKLAHPHDISYKNFLSHKDLLLSLVQGFIPADWVNMIDENSFYETKQSYIEPKFRLVEADKVYHLKLIDREIIFYLLIELQSTVDFLMPYRLLSYTLEIWRDVLKKTPQEETYRKDFLLPAVIPVVLYNGEYNWTAKRSFKELVNGYQFFGDKIVDFSYVLIDVNRFRPDDLKKLSNKMVPVFLLDQKYDIMEIGERLANCSSILKTYTRMEYETFQQWFAQIICAGLESKVADGFMKILDKSSPKEVDVVISNLALTLKKAQEDAKMEGEINGVIKGKLEVAKDMLSCNFPLDTIVNVTKVPMGEVLKISADMKTSHH